MTFTTESVIYTRDDHFAPFAEKMKNADIPDIMIRSFHYYYEQLLEGETGFISSSEAGPVHELPDATDLTGYESQGVDALNRCIVLNLNGGLGTSMGMNGPKSLLTVKDGLTFLDIIVQQTLGLRRTHGVRLPLVLMNSFNTHRATLAALSRYPELTQDIPFGFLQHKEPKIFKNSLMPAVWPAAPEKEWAPPGHGDLYSALLTSGMLAQMLEAGYEYAFVSNSDNLGATIDLSILGYFAQEKLPFLMEVADRTEADCKGGHLAQRPNGQLILREVAQCPPDELDSFQDIERYRFFNTNNLWIHLPTLKKITDEQDGILGLPLIRNEKPVDPTDSDSPRVYQLETAMGSAIGVFPGAKAVRVPRNRFVPIKKNSDLLVLLSDAYHLTESFNLVLTAPSAPLVELDENYYKLIDDLHLRFPHGAPSLANCSSLKIYGDVRFGKNITLQGDVELLNMYQEPLEITDNRQIVGEA